MNGLPVAVQNRDPARPQARNPTASAKYEKSGLVPDFLCFMGVGFEPDRVGALRKQPGGLFLAARARASVMRRAADLRSKDALVSHRLRHE